MARFHVVDCRRVDFVMHDFFNNRDVLATEAFRKRPNETEVEYRPYVVFRD